MIKNKIEYISDSNNFKFETDYVPNFFQTICLKVTGKCMANCGFCCEPNRNLTIINADSWAPLISVASRLGTKRFSLSGGEPLLYEELEELLMQIKNLGGKTFIATADGQLFIKKIDSIHKLIDGVRFSIHGIGLEHNKILKVKNAFYSVEKSIEICQNYKIPVFISVVMTKKVVNQLEKITYWAGNLGVKKIYLFELLDSGFGHYERHKQNNLSFIEILSQIDLLKSISNKFNIEINPIPNNEYYHSILFYGNGQIIVDPIPSNFPQGVIGNWKLESMDSIWENYVNMFGEMRSIKNRLSLY